MKVQELLKSSKILCRIDQDETEFDEVLLTFISDTLTDIYQEAKITTTLKIPIINGEAKVEEGYQIIRVEPTLNINDRIIGKSIFTTHTGILDVLVSEEAPVITSIDTVIELQKHVLDMVKYNVASLWYGYKKKMDLSSFWQNRYEMEKFKRFDSIKAEETYEVALPFSEFFNN